MKTLWIAMALMGMTGQVHAQEYNLELDPNFTLDLNYELDPNLPIIPTIEPVDLNYNLEPVVLPEVQYTADPTLVPDVSLQLSDSGTNASIQVSGSSYYGTTDLTYNLVKLIASTYKTSETARTIEIKADLMQKINRTVDIAFQVIDSNGNIVDQIIFDDQLLLANETRTFTAQMNVVAGIPGTYKVQVLFLSLNGTQVLYKPSYQGSFTVK